MKNPTIKDDEKSSEKINLIREINKGIDSKRIL